MDRNQVKELHGLCRVLQVMLKDFADLKEHTGQLKTFARRLNTTYYSAQSDRRNAVLETIDSLAQFENSCTFWTNWARTYLDRTNICINLVSLVRRPTEIWLTSVHRHINFRTKR